MKMLDWIIEYLRRGWAPIPIKPKSKTPVGSGWPDLRLTEEEAPKHFATPDQNAGVLLGEPSGGLGDVDIDALEAVPLAKHFLPATESVFGRSGKPRSHWLYSVRGLKSMKFATSSDGMIVEIRTDGAQTVVPPSIHPSGEAVTWDVDGTPATVTSDELVERVGELAAATLLTKHWPAEGERHDAALALAGTLLQGGWQESRAEDFVRIVAEHGGSRDVEDKVLCVRSTAKQLAAGEPILGMRRLTELHGAEIAKAVAKWLRLRLPRARSVNRACTDVANGERLIRAYGEDLRFAFHLNKWLVWDGRRWAMDDSARILRMATETARSITKEAADATSSEDREALERWAVQSQNRGRLEAMIWAARPLVPIRAEELDKNQALLNVLNGTLHLPSGALQPHDRLDFITKLAPVNYDADAACPRFLKFLERIMGGRQPLVSFLQCAFGYALTGQTSEQCFFLFYGTGANGKSTLLETMLAVAGDYARPTEFRTLLGREKSDGVRNDLAMLAGLRLVTAVEVGKGRRFDEALIKQLTGSDKVSARFLYGEFFDYVPRFKLFLAANTKPEIRGVDEGIWRRVRLVPFEVQIPPEERNRELQRELSEELPGILAWAARGTKVWYTAGLEVPTEVLEATEAYRESSDSLADFLRGFTKTTEQRNAFVPVAALYDAYVVWAEQFGTDPWEKDTFAKGMAERGHRVQIMRVKGPPERRYIGLTLNSDGNALLGRVVKKSGLRDGRPLFDTPDGQPADGGKAF